jgi:hypothetical protein
MPRGLPDPSLVARTEAAPGFDHPPRPMAQRIGAILWPSFFAAGVATMVFFAFVDPLALRDISMPRLALTREAGYTIAFFLFWAATAGSSLFTWILLRPASRFNAPARRD